MNMFRLAALLSVLASASPLLNANVLAKRLKRLDRNQDGKLSREEAPSSFRKFKFDQADRNKDGFLDQQELIRVSEKLEVKKQAKPTKVAKPVTLKAKSMKVIKDIIYRKDDKAIKGQNKLDLYFPSGKKAFPVLFWIHGGGLHSGDKSKISGVASRFVAEGIGVVSTNYRLYPEARYPTQIEDVSAAFAWTYNNTAKHGGDPKKLFVAGGSAGGHLTALLALNETFLKKHELTTSNILGAIPISGLMDVKQVGAARRKAVWGEENSTLQLASPLHHARKDAPSMLLLHAEHDTPDRRQQNKAMFTALKKAGHPDVSIHELKDRTHNNIRSNLTRQNDTGAKYILKFISRLSKCD
ncbi:MAG: alpha/beta hydrolase fold domain-containing protein [Verrucomicrobiota bacterium]|nr:alpha/beta hydrolase fold domain-containing protein [Verrucomicrobiota bacterium]